jgi:hypothetical protein
MAVSTVTPIVLVLDTGSADTTDAAGGTAAATAADGWSVDLTGYKANRILLKFFADGSGESVIHVDAGDNPPAARAGLGNLDITLTANQVRYIALEAARFMQSDGTLTANCHDTGTRMTCFILPLAV